jgi:pyruvate,water dikinase
VSAGVRAFLVRFACGSSALAGGAAGDEMPTSSTQDRTGTAVPVVSELWEFGRTDVAIVGGKAANLGELPRVEGISVPTGCVVTTDAYDRVVAADPSLADAVVELVGTSPDDHDVVRRRSAAIRARIEELPVPDDVAAAIEAAVSRMGGADVAWAVRSSAMAEDLPAASFAGQLASFLNVVGRGAARRQAVLGVAVH